MKTVPFISALSVATALSVGVIGFGIAPFAPAHAQTSISIKCDDSVVETIAQKIANNPDAGEDFIDELKKLFVDCPGMSKDILAAVLAAGNPKHVRAAGTAAARAAITLAGLDDSPQSEGALYAAKIEEDVDDTENDPLIEAFREESATGQIGGTGPAIPAVPPQSVGSLDDNLSPFIIFD